MKNLADIQEIVKNQTKLCVFVDYNNLSEHCERLYVSEARESMNLRIIQNFLKCDFIKAFVLFKKNMPSKFVHNLETKFQNITLLKYVKDDFIKTASELEDEYTFVYIGNNEDIIRMDAFQKGFTISLKSSYKQTSKVVDFQLTVEELVEFLLETSNICL